MAFDYHIIVIGAGSGGLVVASGAAGLGAKVALIEGHKMGGDCLNYGCVPSKSFLKSAHLAADIRKAQSYGLHCPEPVTDMKAVMDRVRRVIKEIEPHDSKQRYEGLGVDVFEGYGRLEDKHTVSVGEQRLRGQTIVIATGSTAMIPDIPGLSDCNYLTNHSIFNLEHCPKKLIVLGAGPIGLELGQGMQHLGADVTVIDRNTQLFSKDEQEVGPLMKEVLEKEGMTLQLGATIKSVSEDSNGDITVSIEKDGKAMEIRGDALLLSLGRQPVTDKLNCDAVGVKRDEKGYILTNQKLQSTVPNIYACGDVVGPYQFTHMAGYQAGIIIRNCIFKMGAKLNYSRVPWVTFTKPEVAHVGITTEAAKAKGIEVFSETISLPSVDRAKADDDRNGFLKLIFNKKKQLLGASFVGEKSGEMIGLAAMAIAKKQKATSFLNLIFPYPTQAEIYKFASLSITKKAFKPWMKKLIGILFLRKI